MAEDDRLAFEEHYFSCDDCGDALRRASAVREGARAGLAGPAMARESIAAGDARTIPFAPSARKPVWYRSATLPWAIAATLAVMLGYESMSGVQPLPRDGAPLALAPVTLRPESRGAEAVVPLPHNGPVSLAIEVNDAPEHGELAYELRSAEGRSIVSGRVPTPAPGTPLLLLMPEWTLVGPVHYILSVHDAAAAGRLLGEYRFVVAAD
jgi:hypothetical protein